MTLQAREGSPGLWFDEFEDTKTRRIELSDAHRRKKRSQRLGPRRPRTRAFCASDQRTEMVALHPVRRNRVLAWANKYEYAVVQIRDYWQQYDLEGPREEFRQNNKLIKQGQDWYSWYGDGHGPFFKGKKVFAGTWPWRESIEKRGRRPSFQRPCRAFPWHDPRDRSVECDQQTSIESAPESWTMPKDSSLVPRRKRNFSPRKMRRYANAHLCKKLLTASGAPLDLLHHDQVCLKKT